MYFIIFAYIYYNFIVIISIEFIRLIIFCINLFIYNNLTACCL